MWNSETWWMLLWLVLNAPLYLLIGRIVFGSWDGFFQAFDEANGHGLTLAKAQMMLFVLWVGALLAVEYHFFWRL